MSTTRTEPPATPGVRLAIAHTVMAVTVRSAPPWRPRPARITGPSWELPVLAGIVLLASVLYTWGIDHSVYHVFYASAVRSMTDGPVAFFYGAFDPTHSITLDKLPGFLWPQAVSAMVFGFHPWSLVLPQAIEGIGCVVLLHVLVRRWAGVPAGLLAAGFLTLTPVTVGLGRSIVEDAPFVLLLLLAAEATQRAVEWGRSRTLLAAGVWVGVAFQCKMLEAWAVLPALAVTYLVAAPGTVRRRIGHAALAGVATFVVSMSWIAVAALTPVQDRPYIDGTTNNSPLSMVVGYNFLNRFGTVGVDAAGTGSVITGQGPAYPAGPSIHLHDTVLKMFSPQLATQTGWLYPLAFVGLGWGLAVAWRRRVPRTDRALAGYLMWGLWLASFFVAFSVGTVAGHTYYTGVIAVALCALAGAGLVRCWGALRTGGRRAWALRAVVAANVLWCVILTLSNPGFLPWLAPTDAVLCGAALILLTLATPDDIHWPRSATAGLALGLTAILLVPAAWSASALSPRYNQPGGMGAVGPSAQRGGLSARLKPPQRRLLAYLKAHRDGATYLAAVPGWTEASAYVLSANAPILSLGGFTGEVPFPTPGHFRHLVGSGELRYVILGQGSLASSRRGTTTADSIVRWVQSRCTVIGTLNPAGPTEQYLYRCAPLP